jgi:hypothetical protein
VSDRRFLVRFKLSELQMQPVIAERVEIQVAQESCGFDPRGMSAISPSGTDGKYPSLNWVVGITARAPVAKQ